MRAALISFYAPTGPPLSGLSSPPQRAAPERSASRNHEPVNALMAAQRFVFRLRLHDGRLKGRAPQLRQAWRKRGVTVTPVEIPSVATAVPDTAISEYDAMMRRAGQTRVTVNDVRSRLIAVHGFTRGDAVTGG
jgi:hypothetical protein